MSESRTPDLGELLDDYVSYRLDETYVMRPGIVHSYDAANNTVDVLLAIKRKLRALDDSVTLEDFAVLKSVPVAFPRCGKAYLTFPIAKDDRVMVLFADKNLGAWAEGNAKKPVDAEDITGHPLAGAVAYPGLYPKAEAVSPTASTSHVVLGTADANTRVLLGDNDDAGMQFVALAQSTKDEITALKDAVQSFVTTFNSHTHTSACTAGGSPTAPPPSMASNPPAVNDVASDRVKASG